MHRKVCHSWGLIGVRVRKGWCMFLFWEVFFSFLNVTVTSSGHVHSDIWSLFLPYWVRPIFLKCPRSFDCSQSCSLDSKQYNHNFYHCCFLRKYPDLRSTENNCVWVRVTDMDFQHGIWKGMFWLAFCGRMSPSPKAHGRMHLSSD